MANKAQGKPGHHQSAYPSYRLELDNSAQQSIPLILRLTIQPNLILPLLLRNFILSIPILELIQKPR